MSAHRPLPEGWRWDGDYLVDPEGNDRSNVTAFALESDKDATKILIENRFWEDGVFGSPENELSDTDLARIAAESALLDAAVQWANAHYVKPTDEQNLTLRELELLSHANTYIKILEETKR